MSTGATSRNPNFSLTYNFVYITHDANDTPGIEAAITDRLGPSLDGFAILLVKTASIVPTPVDYLAGATLCLSTIDALGNQVGETFNNRCFTRWFPVGTTPPTYLSDVAVSLSFCIDKIDILDFVGIHLNENYGSVTNLLQLRTPPNPGPVSGIPIINLPLVCFNNNQYADVTGYSQSFLDKLHSTLYNRQFRDITIRAEPVNSYNDIAQVISITPPNVDGIVRNTTTGGIWNIRVSGAITPASGELIILNAGNVHQSQVSTGNRVLVSKTDVNGVEMGAMMLGEGIGGTQYRISTQELSFGAGVLTLNTNGSQDSGTYVTYNYTTGSDFGVPFPGLTEVYWAVHIANEIGDLANVSNATPADTNVLKFVTATGIWTPGASGASTFGSLTDVTHTDLQDCQSTVHNPAGAASAKFINKYVSADYSYLASATTGGNAPSREFEINSAGWANETTIRVSYIDGNGDSHAFQQLYYFAKGNRLTFISCSTRTRSASYYTVSAVDDAANSQIVATVEYITSSEAAPVSGNAYSLVVEEPLWAQGGGGERFQYVGGTTPITAVGTWSFRGGNIFEIHKSNLDNVASDFLTDLSTTGKRTGAELVFYHQTNRAVLGRIVMDGTTARNDQGVYWQFTPVAFDFQGLTNQDLLFMHFQAGSASGTDTASGEQYTYQGTTTPTGNGEWAVDGNGDMLISKNNGDGTANLFLSLLGSTYTIRGVELNFFHQTNHAFRGTVGFSQETVRTDGGVYWRFSGNVGFINQGLTDPSACYFMQKSTGNLARLFDTDIPKVTYNNFATTASPTNWWQSSSIPAPTTGWVDTIAGRLIINSTITNTATINIGVNTRPALQLTVDNDFVEFNTDNITGAWTVMIVLQDYQITNSLGQLMYMSQSPNTGLWNFGPWITNSTAGGDDLRYIYNDGTQTTISGSPFNVTSQSVATTIVCFYRVDTVAQTFTSFINGGILVNGTETKTTVNSNVLRIGNVVGRSERAGIQKLGEVAIWNSALTNVQISENTNAMLNYYNGADPISDGSFLKYATGTQKWSPALLSINDVGDFIDKDTAVVCYSYIGGTTNPGDCGFDALSVTLNYTDADGNNVTDWVKGLVALAKSSITDNYGAIYIKRIDTPTEFAIYRCRAGSVFTDNGTYATITGLTLINAYNVAPADATGVRYHVTLLYHNNSIPSGNPYVHLTAAANPTAAGQAYSQGGELRIHKSDLNGDPVNILGVVDGAFSAHFYNHEISNSATILTATPATTRVDNTTYWTFDNMTPIIDTLGNSGQAWMTIVPEQPESLANLTDTTITNDPSSRILMNFSSTWVDRETNDGTIKINTGNGLQPTFIGLTTPAVAITYATPLGVSGFPTSSPPLAINSGVFVEADVYLIGTNRFLEQQLSSTVHGGQIHIWRFILDYSNKTINNAGLIEITISNALSGFQAKASFPMPVGVTGETDRYSEAITIADNASKLPAVGGVGQGYDFTIQSTTSVDITITSIARIALWYSQRA